MKNAGIVGLVVIAAASMLAGCASQAPVRTASAAAVPGTGATPTATLAPDAKSPLELGKYRRVMKSGKEYFCAREPVTGSRTETFERCLTQAQLKSMSEGGQEFLRRQQAHVGQQFTPSTGNTSPSASAVSP